MSELTPDDLVEIELIKRVKYAYFRNLDLKQWDEIRELFTEDASASYGGGAYAFEGRDAIVEFFRAGDQVFVGGGPQMTIGRVVAEGDHVAIEASGTAPLHNGNTYDNRYHFAIDLRDGRVAAVREYMDSHHVAVTLAPPPEA